MNKKEEFVKKAQKKIRLKKHVDELETSVKKNSQLNAVVLKYDLDNDKAPKITGFGKGQIAEKILQVAEDNKIPFYEDPSLVELLAKLDINSEIPPKLYSVVAEILSFVYKMDRLAKKKVLQRRKQKPGSQK